MSRYKVGRFENNRASNREQTRHPDEDAEEYFDSGQVANQFRQMAPLNCPDSIYGVPLTGCHVVYLGACAQEPGTTGLQAVQKPLVQLYLKNNNSAAWNNSTPSFVSSIIRGGAEATLIVYSFGLKFIYGPNSDSPGINIWFPISNLFVCAAVRCVRSLPLTRRFVPLDLAEADESDDPPLFAAIFRQSRARHITECFCFVCNNKQNAMDLVLACTTSFETFVRTRPRQPSTETCLPNSNSGTDEGYGDGKNLSNEDAEITEVSECDEQSEEWQPILVRRVWLPAPVPLIHPKMYQSTTNRGSSHAKKKMLSRKSKSVANKRAKSLAMEEQQQLHQQFLLPNSYLLERHFRKKMPLPPVPATSVDANLDRANGFIGTNGRPKPKALRRWPQQPLSTSSLSLHENHTYRGERTLNRLFTSKSKDSVNQQQGPLHQCHRQWSSQPSSLDAVGAVEDVTRCQGLRGDLTQARKQSFVNRFRNLIFPPKRVFAASPKTPPSGSKLQQQRRFQVEALCNDLQQNNNGIDYALVASDEADLLRLQSDCYGGGANNNNNTLTRHPLPNERAFMISIQNQQQMAAKNQKDGKIENEMASFIGKGHASSSNKSLASLPWFNKSKLTSRDQDPSLADIDRKIQQQESEVSPQRQQLANKHFNLSAFSNGTVSPPSYWNDEQ